VTMVNGSPSDRIVLANTANGGPNFNGLAGSTLAVDANLGPPGSTADVLQVGSTSGNGNVTGSTGLLVNNTSGNPNVLNLVGIPVAESGGTPAATATTNVAGNFTMSTIHSGLVDWNLFFLPKGAANNPGTPGFNTWFLASSPSAAAEELPSLLTAATNVWHQSAGTWFDRTADLRDYFMMPGGTTCNPLGGGADMAVKARPCAPIPGGVGPGVWFRAFGDWQNSSATTSFSQFGRTFNNDVGYKQDIWGVQIGADLSTNRIGYQTFLLGLLGGAGESNVHFNNNGGSVRMRGGNAGFYATYLNGGWFVDGLFLANFMRADLDDTANFGLSTNTDITSLGGHIDTGYRFNWTNWFAEPLATIEVVNTHIDNLNFPNASVQMDDTAVLGRLGGRVGTWWDSWGWRWEPAVIGSVWHNFNNSPTATFNLDGTGLNLSDANFHRTWGEIGGMINAFEVGSGWSAFLKGQYQFANDLNGGSVQGGFRYQWR
jgi:hypothetical protein